MKVRKKGVLYKIRLALASKGVKKLIKEGIIGEREFMNIKLLDKRRKAK